MRESIIIDTDPGQDDAVAILLALASRDRLDVRGITTVAGNVPVNQAFLNAARICDLAGTADVDIFRGAERPLLFDLETAEFVCGPDGLAGADLPASSRRPADEHAVEFLIRELRAAPERGLTVCALGPLTNIALAFRLCPDVAHRVRRLVIMGGAMNLGNMTPAAEFNVYVDPHAAAIVLASGVPLVMFGLHATHQAVPSAEDVTALAAMASRTGRAVHGMLTRPRPGGLGTSAHPMHDPCVVSYLLWPDLFSGRDCFVEVETSAGPVRGRSTIDWNGRLGRAPNALVIDRLDRAALFERLGSRLSELP